MVISSVYFSRGRGRDIVSIKCNKSIHHEYEGRIENSVLRMTIWHHKACLVMTNGDPKGWTFLSYSHQNNGIFFLLTIRFHILFLTKGSQKFLNTPRCYMLWWRHFDITMTSLDDHVREFQYNQCI